MPPAHPTPHAVVAGFGLPGRSIADWLEERKVSFTVIERNPEVVQRCARGGTNILAGDARDPALLRQAGIERATLVAIAVPDDMAVLEIVTQVRQMNATATVIARCAYVSTGMEAKTRGADLVVVAEQVIAREFVSVISAIGVDH